MKRNSFILTLTDHVTLNMLNKIIHSLQKHLNNDMELKLSNLPVSQQLNTYDCGVYILLFTDIIIQRIPQKQHIEYWKEYLALLYNNTHFSLSTTMMLLQ